MCGISGFIDFRTKLGRADLVRMTDALIHRGPDASGYECWQTDKYTIGLGHRRLSIIDLSEGGKQPKTKSNWTITYNGEIYNFEEVRKELQQLGHSFTSSSDTEVIISAFIQWGPDAVQRFIGMFAFALYDSNTKTVYLFRDRAGVKPLFYYQKDGMLLFSSELKSFHAIPQFDKTINPNTITSFMEYGYIPNPHCIYTHCRKLEPGHFLKVNLNNQDISKHKYWDVEDCYAEAPLDISEEEALKEIEKTLVSAFNYRMVADVPVGVFLSGGYDSSLVTAMLQKNATQKINTFTIGFEDQKYNEATYAKEVAEHLGTNHTEYFCTQKEALEIIPTLPHFFDEPFGDSSAIPTILVSKLAVKDVKVALSADAGDEIFAGYSRNASFLKYYNTRKKLPDFLSNAGGAALNVLNKNNFGDVGARNKDKITQLLRLKNPSPSEFMKIYLQNLTPSELKQLLKNYHTGVSSAFDNKKTYHQDALNTMLQTEYKTYLVDDILAKVDRAGMSVSLEGREPFLDQRIIELVARLPSSMKIKNGSLKYLEKELTFKYLPREMMERPKQGFGVPIMQWLKTDMADYVHTYLGEKLVKEQGIFDVALINKMREGFLKNEQTSHYSWLWFVIMFNAWYEKWQ